jgi:hypothetical protein
VPQAAPSQPAPTTPDIEKTAIGPQANAEVIRASEIEAVREESPDKPNVASAQAPLEPSPMLDAVPQAAPSQPAPTTPDIEKTAIGPQASAEVSQAGVIAALKRWVAAQENQNVEHYLATYAAEFTPADTAMSRSDWEAAKTKALRELPKVKIELLDMDIVFREATLAEVRFSQVQRREEHGAEMVEPKMLVLTYSRGQWLIREEKAPLIKLQITRRLRVGA